MYEDIKARVKRVLEGRDYIEEVEFVKMTADEIRMKVDFEYNGQDRTGNNEVLKVYYRDDLCCYPVYVLHWLWVRPDELANSLEV